MSEASTRVADHSSRQAALDVGQSVIVQAPAGSGKTELLIQRFLKLLALVDHPEEVLAITFTRKAAGEMRDRLLSALHSAATEEIPESEHEAQTWQLARAVLDRDALHHWHLTEHPARLRIMTIDALNAVLTRQMPLLARAGASLDVSPVPKVFYDEAAIATLEMVAEPFASRPALETLIGHLDNNLQSAASRISEMLARREQWLRHLLAGGGGSLDRPGMERAIRALVRNELRGLREKFPAGALQALVQQGRQSAEVLARVGRESAVLALAEGREPACEQSDLALWKGVAELLLTSTHTWRRQWTIVVGFEPGKKDRKDELADLVTQLSGDESLREALEIVRGLPVEPLSEMQWQALHALLEVLPLAAAQLELVFRRHGQVDYTAVARAALDALGGPDMPTDLALALDYRIQHILADEFQDTSASQYELLSRLTAGWTPGDGRTLFCVGDPMQSIYRFREAEVSLFLRAWDEGIAGLPLEPVRLSVNFRSQQGVVDWVNQSFPGIMPAEVDLQTAAVPFTRSDPFHPPLAGQAVQFHPLIDGHTQDEADRVAELVLQERAANPDADIAILVSGRKHLQDIVPTLRAAGLAPQAVEIEHLDRRPVVHDLVALTRAMLHRGDRTAWLSLLRAAWCGLTLADLHALAADSPTLTVPELLADAGRVSCLSADGQARVRRFVDALWPVLAESGRRPLRRWVEGAWRRLGGPACLDLPADLDNAQAFFALLDTVEKGGVIEDPVVLDERLSELYAMPARDADSKLRLMTIHKAKGLQFDVVIVPGLDRTGGREERRLLSWMEFPRAGGEIDLVLSPLAGSAEGRDPLHDYLHGLEQRRRLLEQGRLLYVAVTRARQRAHLLGRARTTEKEGESVLTGPKKRSMLATLWPVAQAYFDSALAAVDPNEGERRRQHNTPESDQYLWRMPLAWQLPEPDPGIRPQTRIQPQRLVSEEAISFDWAGQTARYIGIVVHRALQQIAQSGTSELQLLVRVARAQLLEMGVRACDLDQANTLVESAIRNSLEDRRGQWVLAATHSSAQSELALTAVEGGVMKSFVLDRTFVDQDGLRWIIDFKIGVHEGRDKDAFFDQEVARYKAQLARYAAVMALYDVRPIRSALYFPLYRGWRQWDPFAA